MMAVIPRPTFSLPVIPSSIKAGEVRTFLEKMVLQITQEFTARPPKYEAVDSILMITPDRTKTYRISLSNAGAIVITLVQNTP